MAVDNSKLAYHSAWEIDQLVATAEVPVNTGTTTLYSVSLSLPALPLFEIYFKPTGASKWYQGGVYSNSNTVAGLQTFTPSMIGRSLNITTSVAGTARYFVWSDKVNY